MKRNKYIIIGMGRIGQELALKISRDIEIVCIDLNAELEELVKNIRKDCIFVTGDATSRLVLEEAGVAESDGVIIATTSEKVNIEAARIIKEHFDVNRTIALGTSKAGIESLEKLGVEVENIFTASAVAIRNRLIQSSRAAHAIGLGKEEILEVEVHPHSRLANRPLRTLTPLRWKIGLIYRDENIIVPKRETVLKPRDRVVILGEPSVLKTVSEILTFRFERFPLEYGSTAIAYLTGDETEQFFSEIDYLFSIFPLKRMVFLYSKKAARNAESWDELITKSNIRNPEGRKTSLAALPAMEETVSELKGDHGIIIMAKDTLRKSALDIFRSSGSKVFLNTLIEKFHCPIILTAGTYPYEKTCIPCTEPESVQHTMETALEVSTSLQNEVTALLVNPSKYISSDEDMHEFESMKKNINDVSSIYKTSVKKEILQGNPIKSITASLNLFNFLITGTESWSDRNWYPAFLNPDISWNIVRESSISTMLIPSTEELL
ncbi:TrkA family potassium uptake protein [bacterium]|nr:TrkA family potassium uptake protein [bacterium]